MLPSRTPPGATPRTLLHVKLALAAVGVATWFYGYHVDDTRVRWLGIGFLAAAFLIRFIRRRDGEHPGD